MILSILCYLRKDGRTLMLHRNKKHKDFHRGKFNGVGGKFEAGETPEECLKREVYEETGYRLDKYRYEGLITFPLFDGVNDWYTFVYTGTEFSNEQRDSEEGTLHWIQDEDLLDLNLWEGDPYFLRWIYCPEFEGTHFSAKFIYKNKTYISHEVEFYGGIL
ncbi:MAG: hypothetical protein AVO33_03655 [delta proteobacterium ML8_F1]|nr:MAG: hypothetical protein AVO33_03655 [delta proteobacterium ML8_F1]